MRQLRLRKWGGGDERSIELRMFGVLLVDCFGRKTVRKDVVGVRNLGSMFIITQWEIA